MFVEFHIKRREKCMKILLVRYACSIYKYCKYICSKIRLYVQISLFVCLLLFNFIFNQLNIYAYVCNKKIVNKHLLLLVCSSCKQIFLQNMFFSFFFKLRKFVVQIHVNFIMDTHLLICSQTGCKLALSAKSRGAGYIAGYQL